MCIMKMNHGMKGLPRHKPQSGFQETTMFANIRLTGGTSLGAPHGLNHGTLGIQSYRTSGSVRLEPPGTQTPFQKALAAQGLVRPVFFLQGLHGIFQYSIHQDTLTNRSPPVTFLVSKRLPGYHGSGSCTPGLSLESQGNINTPQITGKPGRPRSFACAKLMPSQQRDHLGRNGA